MPNPMAKVTDTEMAEVAKTPNTGDVIGNSRALSQGCEAFGVNSNQHLRPAMQCASTELENLRKKNYKQARMIEKLHKAYHDQVQTIVQLVELIENMVMEADVLPIGYHEDDTGNDLIEDLGKAVRKTCAIIKSMRLELESIDAEMAAPKPKEN